MFTEHEQEDESVLVVEIDAFSVQNSSHIEPQFFFIKISLTLVASNCKSNLTY